MMSYRASPAIWDHMLLFGTHRMWSCIWTCFNRSQAGWYSIYLPWRDGRLSWSWCWLHTEMIYHH